MKNRVNLENDRDSNLNQPRPEIVEITCQNYAVSRVTMPIDQVQGHGS